MGIDYTAISGYGVEFTKEMCEKASTDAVEFDGDMVDFVEELLSETTLECAVSGSYYAGDTQCWVLISDPLNKNVRELIDQINKLPFNLNIKSQSELEWISDILVH